jgi:hypothetical protein
MYRAFELEIIYEEYITLTKLSSNIYVISIGESYIEFIPTKAKLSGKIKWKVTRAYKRIIKLKPFDVPITIKQQKEG